MYRLLITLGLLRTFPKMFSGSQLRKDGNLVFGEHIKINKNLIKLLVDRLDKDGVPSVTSPTETTARFNITLTDSEKEEAKSSLPKAVKNVLLEHYGSESYKIGEIYCWRTVHVPEDKVLEKEFGSAYWWHTDRHRTDLLKVFVYLTDVGEDCGPFTFLSKRETKNFYRRSFEHRASIKIKNLEGQREFLGKAGSIALCNTTVCLHRAGVPTIGKKRDILQLLVYAP